MTSRPAAGAVIGTAGHIDHGKTSLVQALTGIDTDRLKEEKARGITIELGFAHLPLPSGRIVGLVDVPGHERFVRAMVAGAVGFDLVVLVVAADEGVMPQTREHLDICALLGVRRGVVALTKIDAVGTELRALAEADVREALARTVLADAPIVPCSARTGEGLDALRATIDVALDADLSADAWPPLPRSPDAPARLPIDRVFTMKGFGSVVTGTLWAGRLNVGEDIELLPSAAPLREKIRGLQIHGGQVEAVAAGHRVAINLPLPRAALTRGAVVAQAGTLEAGRIFDAHVELLSTTRRPLGRRSHLLLHAGTQQVAAVVRLLDDERLAPGARAYVEIEAQTPVVLLPGDRVVLRGTEPQRGYGTTIGGGVVVRVLGPRSRRGARTTSALLAENLDAHRRGDVEARTRLEVERAGEQGVDRAGLQRRLPFSPKSIDSALERLSSAHLVYRFDRSRDAYVSAAARASLRARAVEALAADHAAAPLEPAVPREALRSRVAEDPRLLHLVLDSLIADGTVVADRDRVRLAGHSPSAAASATGLDALADRVVEHLRAAGVSPPRPVDLSAGLHIPQAELDRALDLLARRGELVRVQGLYFGTEAVAAARARLVAYLDEHGSITPQAWKELIGATRKYTIPLAEHFDAEKLTIRVGEVRKRRG